MLFSDVVGQTELKRHLIEEIQQDKISHAQLFAGKSGYGTLPLALAFVQYLFCENRQSQDSCGICTSCRKVQTLQHPDLHFSFPTVQSISLTSDGLLKEWREQILSEPYFDLNGWIRTIDDKERKPIISVHESAEILRKLNLRSFEGGYKVMIIWMAEEMNAATANKLLKIIEEPPSRTLFLLISESTDYILQTIISRTQLVKVPRITMEDLSAFLRKKHGQNPINADSIAARVEGNLIDAKEFLGNHEEETVNRELFINLMRVCYRKNVIDMLNWTEDVSVLSKERQKVFIKYSLHMFRQSMLRNYTEDQLTQVSEEEDKFLLNFSRFITGNNVYDFMKTFNDAHYHIDRNANGKLLFTNLCFQVMRFIHAA